MEESHRLKWPQILPVLLLSCMPPACLGSEDRTATAAKGDLLITGVSIVDPEANRASPPRDILIDQGSIVEVAAAGEVSADRASIVLSADGLFAMAGLIDVHAHLGDGGLGVLSEEDRRGALSQFVRYGVTTVFVPGGGGGNDHQLARWKERCDAREFLCPGIYGSGALITAPGSHPIGTIWDMPEDVDPAVAYARGGVAISEAEPAGPLLDRKVAMGVDAIKIIIENGPGPWLPKPRLSTAKITELVQAGHDRGLRVFAHVSMADHVEDAVAAGVDGVMHSAEDPIPDSVLADMASQGIFYIATLALYNGFYDHALGNFEQEPFALAGVSKRALKSLEDEAWRSRPVDPPEMVEPMKQALQDNLRRAHEAGVPLALGSDVNNPTVFPGYSAHEELALLVEAGLTPAQALKAATIGGASFLEKEASLGRIASGYEADLLILKENPLEDILNTRTLYAVVHDGQVVDDVVSGTRSEPISTAAEFEPQDTIWMTWTEEPCLGGPPWGDSVLDVTEVLAGYVNVRLHVFDEDEAERLAVKLANRQLGEPPVDIFVYANVVGMIRDYGPAFVRRASGELGVADFNWNNGGVRPVGHARTLKSEALDRGWAERLGLPVTSRSRLVSEGGAREVNGRGTMLLVEAVELQRNPGWTRENIETEYKRHLGVKKVIWLKKGLYEEEALLRLPGDLFSYGTGGHVDTIARFADASTILLAEVSTSERDASPISAESFARMEENFQLLDGATDQDGRPFRILRVPAADLAEGVVPWEDLGAEKVLFPEATPGEPLRYLLGGSYLNYIIANGVVVLPKFGRPGGPESTRAKDAQTLEIFQEVFPGRQVVQVDMVNLSHCGGGFHCGSLHQPAVSVPPYRRRLSVVIPGRDTVTTASVARLAWTSRSPVSPPGSRSATSNPNTSSNRRRISAPGPPNWWRSSPESNRARPASRADFSSPRSVAVATTCRSTFSLGRGWNLRR